jgi:uncharacterized membrane protein YtjA (UPF0391 family)
MFERYPFGLLLMDRGYGQECRPGLCKKGGVGAFTVRVGDAVSPDPWNRKSAWRKFMLYYALAFFVIALLAGIFGFYGLAGTAASIAKILFLVFLVLFIISLIFGRRPRV